MLLERFLIIFYFLGKNTRHILNSGEKIRILIPKNDKYSFARLTKSVSGDIIIKIIF